MLRDRINTALKAAMKDKEQLRVCTLRLVVAALNEREIAARGGDDPTELTDAATLDVLAKMVRQREESAKAYDEGGRPELAKQERAEIRVIREFMPKPLPPEEVTAAVREAIRDSEAHTIKDMGKVMGVLKAKYPGRMDFGKVGATVRQALG
ncbi:GatB/YqeY domain-containing protein [Pikeienuella piscinae]|uniref:GatB/YqeY domain-containing protein n=1 Tax=Pikeienuella piscinae TaxID=2748098 RepID=A0A7L5C3F8_9RHOB|nr:GatB/YqeY domain-containing protein [Pikeienuella piscinae]QIE56409.1 GatB/YqeY domain-containing protein [Pikeienuella piscinae]